VQDKAQKVPALRSSCRYHIDFASVYLVMSNQAGSKGAREWLHLCSGHGVSNSGSADDESDQTRELLLPRPEFLLRGGAEWK
jgi:hypothetical protein